MPPNWWTPEIEASVRKRSADDVARAGIFGKAMMALNVTMLFSIPFFGGHYLVDVLAGAGVFTAALVVVRILDRTSAGCASPEFAAACDGACSTAVPSR